MQERSLGRIQPDMDVCDVTGEKVGTVARVYRHRAPGGAGAGAAGGPPGEALTATPAGEGIAPAGEEVLEVRTGLLGLGTHYDVPLSAVRDTTEGGVFLSRPKDDFEGLGWHRKPAYLDEPR